MFVLPGSHDCSYLSDEIATTLFADPDVQIEQEDYQTLTVGFRRSGKYFYRPQCKQCRHQRAHSDR